MTDKKPILDVESAVSHRAKHRSVVSDKRRTNRMLIADAGSSKMITITPDQYGKLAIDPRYQREEVGPFVASLREAIRRGTTPPPIHVAKRAYEEDGIPKNKLWIVDGQQRMWALVDAGHEILALVHEVSSLDEEKRLFHVLNMHKRVGANHMIAAYPGPSTAVLREINDDPKHTLYQRILLERYSGSHNKINSATIIRAIVVAFGKQTSGTTELLGAMDQIVTTAAGSARVKQFLGVLGQVFEKRKPSWEMIIAFGRAYARLGREPSQSEIGRLKRLKLEAVVAATPSERQLLMMRRILKVFGAQPED